ncbi:MAG TPA: hypothetical protein VKF16_04040 [Candidatus Dormibacteraeota bacterium]|nr:hypothetical protein [Candidatus Dormibacteraeota bacterium]
MAVQQLKLESVRRKTGGRIHLTPRVPKSGPVTTLCNQTLAAGTFTAVEVEADCSNCIRRSQDQGRISGAFFAQDEGSELLRLSLEQAKFRNPTRGDAPRRPGAPEKPVVWPTAKPPPEVIPDQLGELVTRGFRPAGEGVWRSPGGVVVKLRKRAKEWRFEELVFEGAIIATRVDEGVRLKAGDVEVNPTDDGYEVILKKG